MRTITLLTIFMLLQLFLPAQSIYVCPDTTHVLDPGEFQVCIHVDEEITDFRGYRVVLSYDEEVMTFCSAERGPVMDGYGSYWWRVFDEGPDSLHIECMGFGAGVSVDGPGSILTMTFHTEVTGITPLHFKNFTIYDVSGLPMEGLEAHDGAVDIKLPVGIGADNKEPETAEVVPNPFAGRAVVRWEQQAAGHVEIQLYSTCGIQAQNWNCGTREAGPQEKVIVTDIPSGIYILRICEGKAWRTKKIKIK